MRYKSLNHFTANLPLLAKNEVKVLLVVHQRKYSFWCCKWSVQEIDGVINQYKKKYMDLTVVLTGGDTKFLSNN